MNINLDLITACIKRERRAEYELYRESYSYLMGICRRYTRSNENAKEMLNLGFTKILYNLEKYKPEIPFKTWVRKIMVNIIIDEYRKEKKHKENLVQVENYYEEVNFSEVNEVMLKMDVDQIHELINKLPPVSQKVFNLYVVDGFNHKEISGMLDMTESTSKWHLHFSRNKLKEMLSKLIPPLNPAR